MKKLLAMLLTVVACYVSIALAGTAPMDAYNQTKENKAVLVDVREENEIKDGMINLAQWFPLSKFTAQENWKNDFIKMTQGKTIYLYCRSGNRSEKVKNLLKQNNIDAENIGGYETLKNVLPTKKP